ncbi:MAG: DNA repair protein RecO [Deltaproteobacteria bacterium]|nr:DNA repair protein RecO [Deltaproteobacteria bacterium]
MTGRALRGGGPGLVVDARGLVLRLVPYRESDRIVQLFTDAVGRVSALARGGRRSSRRFGGALQPFVLVRARLRQRPRLDLAELIAAEPLRSFERLAGEPRALGRAGYLCELVQVLTREHDPLPGVLELLCGGLELLGDPAADAGALLRGFEVALLDAVGIWPDHRRCARCGRTIDPGRPIGCRDDVDGVLCAECGGEPLPAALWRRLLPRPLPEVAADPLAEDAARLIGRRTLARIRTLAPQRLRSVAFLQQLGEAL